MSGRENQSLNNTTFFSPHSMQSKSNIHYYKAPEEKKNNAWNVCICLHTPITSLPQIFTHNRWVAFWSKIALIILKSVLSPLSFDMVCTIVSLNSLNRYTFNEAQNKMWELILNENEEVQNSAENSFTSYGFNPTDQMPLENTSNALLCNKQFKNMSVVCIQIMYYSTACVKETDDASSVSGFACRKSLLQLWAWFKPNTLLEQCGNFF